MRQNETFEPGPTRRETFGTLERMALPRCPRFFAEIAGRPVWQARALALVLVALLVGACGEPSVAPSTTTTTSVTTTLPDASSTTTSSTTTTGTEIEAPTAPTLPDDWVLETDHIVLAGESGVSVFAVGTWDAQELTSTPMAAAFGGSGWGLVLHPADGSEAPRTSSEPVWWYANGSSQATIAYQPPTNPESGEPFEIQLFGVFDIEGVPSALIRIHQFQNDDLWLLQPLDGGPEHRIGLLAGGQVVYTCAVADGQGVYIAAYAEDGAGIHKRSLDGEYQGSAVDGGWSGRARACIAPYAPSELLGMVQFWDEEGNHLSTEIITADADLTITGSGSLPSEVTHAVGLDTGSTNDLVITTLDGSVWYMLTIRDTSATLLPLEALTASFVD